MRVPPGIERAGEVWVSARDGARLVPIEAGVWKIGAREGDIFAEQHSKPAHQVALSAYLIDESPVCCAAYQRFIEDDGYGNPDWWSPRGWIWKETARITGPAAWEKPGWDAPELPVAGVSWYEAEAYARWAGRALPTEAQWERAAGGPDALRFPWGRDLPRSEHANFDGRVGMITPPGRYPAGRSPEGLNDMAGNVNNWCRDWYDPHGYHFRVREALPTDPCVDDQALTKSGRRGRRKVDKGGGYLTAAVRWEVLTCVGKVAWSPRSRELWNGFRCALTLEP